MKSSLRIVYSLIVFILGIVLLSVLTVLFMYENSQTKVTFDLVNHTNVVRHSFEKLFSTLKDAELAHNRYLLTNDSSQLNQTLVDVLIERQFHRIDSLVANDEIQKHHVQALKKLYEARLNMLEIPVEWNKQVLKENDSLYAEIKIGNILLDSIRHIHDKIQAREIQLLEKRQAYADRHSLLPTIIGIGVSLFSILIFILAFYFTNAELKNINHLNNELESKNVQLEKYAWELSSFTHITSHDMQEPLRKIELFISLIEDREKKNLSPEALTYFEKIKFSVNRMRQLFFSILNFTIADHLKNSIEDVDLNNVLSETLESLQIVIQKENALVKNEPLPVVKGIRYQLIQLFENIISNALKYKRNEVIPEIIISCAIWESNGVSVRNLKKDTTYYKIDFRDNGIGFDQKYSDKIFEIFQRLHTTSHSVGIGLSICRKIAQNHNGMLTAKGELNKGSVFSFYIPVD